MKHKLTVLACVGLALLLSSGYAFAQDAITVVGGTLNRCANNQPVQVLITNTNALGAIGLPLVITGPATFADATPGPALGGFLTADNWTGTAGVANAAGGCLAPGVDQHIWTLLLNTTAACTGDIEIDTAFYPPAGAVLLADCSALLLPGPVFNKGVLTLTNQTPICGTNDPVSVNWAGSVVDKVLNASDPDVCDNPLLYSLVGIVPPVTGTATVSPDGKFNYTATCADKGTHTVTFRATDACGAYVDCTFPLTVTNTAPICGTNPPENVYFQTGVVNKQLNASDPDGNPITFSMVTVGKGTVTPDGVYNWATVCADVGTHTITFRVSDGCDSTDCTFDVTVYQNAPVAIKPPDVQVNWNAPNVVVPLTYTDDGCKGPWTWSLVSAIPAPENPITIVGSNLTFDPDCLDFGKGPIAITVQVYDGEKYGSTTFTIEVINPDPVITCPANLPLVVAGDFVDVSASAVDQYGDALVYNLVSFIKLSGTPGGPNEAPDFNTATGQFTWQTHNDNVNDNGLWEVTIGVSDACGGYDECSFTIKVLTFTMCIRDSDGDDVIEVLSGDYAHAYVTLSDGYELGGINLLICYDQSGLSFLGATPMGNLAAWEYFTWRYNVDGNCGTGCPTGYLRIVAIADLDNGPTKHPLPEEFILDGMIIDLKFYVSSDLNYIGQCFNVGFCTLECGDNALSSKTGDTLFIPIGSDQSCIDPEKHVARDIIFLDCLARICVQEPPDDRGDINLNGIAYEVGDAVLLTNYFIYGDVVWHPVYKLSQILASDVNDDGIGATVADLIYLIRVMTGDANPYPATPKLSPYANNAVTSVRMDEGVARVSTTSSSDIGGAYFVFRYSGIGLGEPTLAAAASGLNVRSSASNGELRVLVYPNMNELAKVSAGTNELVTIPTVGNGTLELVDVQISDADGALLSTSLAKIIVPTEYALQQNYPNPFNAGTVMRIELKAETDWTLTVYNIAGQVVRTFSGHDGAGVVPVTWDGSDEAGNRVASGVYFYRVNADNFTATRKMTLLK